MPPSHLTSKVVFVTGATAGLGKAIACRFLEAGASVITCGTNEERMKSTIAELSAKGTFRGILADLSSSEAIGTLFKQLRDEFGRLDILINNAGIMDQFDGVGSLDPTLWDRIIAVNLTAPFLLSRLAVQHYLEQEEPRGQILNIISMAGKVGLGAGAAYTASKHGLVGLTKNTASYYGEKGIRCNGIIVGPMRTNVRCAFADRKNEEGCNRIMGLLQSMKVNHCDIDEVADLCVSLTAGPGSRQINGALINVDKGWGSLMG
ncbi:hypothetical protein BDV39DRAFT_189821 [Aspergillus sergii]|uniref:NAD(P)-binding protein n=1 Tax=Aspergillus sergii TaxID=1034303 RepID=A0A5N6XGB8_9EURO|nr:hypothetical protein BDV39DRAFT_189821 [Aspergillus sergii]